MAIYGVALLAACYIVGIFLGDVFGGLVGVKANVGGVGFAMLFLILLSNKGIDEGWLDSKAQSGIAFWSAMLHSYRCCYEFYSERCSSSEGWSFGYWRRCCWCCCSFCFDSYHWQAFWQERGEVRWILLQCL